MTPSEKRERALLDEDGPASWLFDPVSERIVTANRAALAFFGESSLFALAERSFALDSPFLAFAREVQADGTPRLKRVVFSDASSTNPQACRLVPVTLPSGGEGLRAELHPWRAEAAGPEARRYAEALRALPAPVILIRSDGHIVFANDAAGRLLGTTEGDLATRIGPEAATAVLEGLRTHSHVSRAFDLAVGGTLRRCHFEGRRLADPVIGVPLDLILLRDLTGIAQLETALSAERQRLRELVTLAADFTWESDAQGRILALSDRFTEVTGLPADVFTGAQLGAAAEEDAATLLAAAPDRFDELAVTLTPPGGRRVSLALSGRARRDSAGHFLGYDGVGRRVRLKPQAAVSDTETRWLAHLVNAAQDTLLVVGPNGRIRFANAPAERLFGGPRTGLEGRTLASILAPAARLGLAADTSQALLGLGQETVIRTLDGAERAVRLAVRTLDRGPTLCFVLSDLSAYKAAEEALRRARDAAEAANRQKSEFLARVSHELRTPLNAIIGFAEIMRDERLGPLGNPRYVGYARDIHHSGHLMLSLINDLIDLSKVEAGRLSLKFQTVDVGQIVDRAVHLMEPAAADAGIVLETQIVPGLAAVVADERSVEQIVLNLLSNAVKFTKRGGKVVASAKPTAEGGVTIAVRDTGIGMSDADLKIALEPFRRVARPDVLDKPGTGIGLPLAKALTEANLAEFRIRSTPRAGTAIEIGFPPGRVAANG